MSAVAASPVITPVDRFTFTLCLAIICHAIIVLGITFSKEDNYQPRFDSMEIILVQQEDPTPPEEATHLAQANTLGGGNTETEVTPSSPLPPPFPDSVPKITAPPPTPQQPEPVAEKEAETTVEKEAEAQQLQEQIVAESARPETSKAEPDVETIKEPELETRPKKSATQLLRNSFEIASLSAQVKQKLESRAKRPRRKFISASTKSYKYAAYMEAWRAKVERVGNLNYPDEARKRKLSGSLVLDVALNPDGSLNQITVRRSSGHKILDNSAIGIVKLASPYAPFPENISIETDILHITRTWQFLNNRGFQ